MGKKLLRNNKGISGGGGGGVLRLIYGGPICWMMLLCKYYICVQLKNTINKKLRLSQQIITVILQQT